MLLLAEPFYLGWSGTLDGQPVPMVRADPVMRGVMVPTGEHRIELELKPPRCWQASSSRHWAGSPAWPCGSRPCGCVDVERAAALPYILEPSRSSEDSSFSG
jgi:hypothetical protein